MTTELPPDGGDDIVLRQQALQDADIDWRPEYPGKKFGPLGGGVPDQPLDPAILHMGPYGPLTNTAIGGRGLYMFDLDIDDPVIIGAVLDVLTDDLGTASCIRYRPNSVRLAALYKSAEEDELYRSLKGTDGAIEVLCGPRAKLTAFGTHLDKVTGVRSRLMWDGTPGDIRKADMASATAAEVDRFLENVSELLGDDAKLRRGTLRDNATGVSPDRVAEDIDDLCAALACVPNSSSVSWREWNRIGMAVYVATDGADQGLLSFIDWTIKGGWRALDAAAGCIKRWEAYGRCPPRTIGCGTIFKLAADAGYRRPPPDDIFADFARMHARIRAEARKAEADFNARAYDEAGERALENFTIQEI